MFVLVVLCLFIFLCKKNTQRTWLMLRNCPVPVLISDWFLLWQCCEAQASVQHSCSRRCPDLHTLFPRHKRRRKLLKAEYNIKSLRFIESSRSSGPTINEATNFFLIVNYLLLDCNVLSNVQFTCAIPVVVYGPLGALWWPALLLAGRPLSCGSAWQGSQPFPSLEAVVGLRSALKQSGSPIYSSWRKMSRGGQCPKPGFTPGAG